MEIGDKIQYKSKRNYEYFDATVIKKMGTRLKLHYDGYSAKWDEWSDFYVDLKRYSKVNGSSFAPEELVNNEGGARGCGIIRLQSLSGDIINHGLITTESDNDICGSGDILIICENGQFKNFGTIRCANLYIIARGVDISEKGVDVDDIKDHHSIFIY